MLFREEESLVKKHIFELLYFLTESLALAERDDKMYGTQEHSRIGLDHVERIIRVKRQLLNERRTDRVKPVGWSEAILEVAVRWLMRQCGRMETECRHKCMDLAFKLAPCIDGIHDTKEYFQLRLRTETETYFLARFEGGSSSETNNIIYKDALNSYITLVDLVGPCESDGGRRRSGIGSGGQLAKIHAWLAMLTAPLDCYTWVFGRRLLTPSSLFANGKSCIWHSLSYFVEHVASRDLGELLGHLQQHHSVRSAETTGSSRMVIVTPSELEQYRADKCTVLVRMLDFLCAIMGNYASDVKGSKCIPVSFWSEKFFMCLVNLCLDPQSLGFNLNDHEVFSQLPGKTHDFLKLFMHQQLVAAQEKFKVLCSKRMNGGPSALSLESLLGGSGAVNQDWIRLSQLATGY